MYYLYRTFPFGLSAYNWLLFSIIVWYFLVQHCLSRLTHWASQMTWEQYIFYFGTGPAVNVLNKQMAKPTLKMQQIQNFSFLKMTCNIVFSIIWWSSTHSNYKHGRKDEFQQLQAQHQSAPNVFYPKYYDLPNQKIQHTHYWRYR